MPHSNVNIPDDKIAHYREAFELFDQDGNGTISVEEFGTVMQKLNQGLSNKELGEIIARFDANSDGSIDFNEFLVMMRSETEEEDEIREVFKVFDKDGNGKISLTELKDAMGLLGMSLTEMDFKVMMTEADTNGDNEIDYNEFRCMILGP